MSANSLKEPAVAPRAVYLKFTGLWGLPFCAFSLFTPLCTRLDTRWLDWPMARRLPLSAPRSGI